MTYTRGLARIPGVLWLVLGITAGLVSLVYATHQGIQWVREDERRAVLASVDSLRPIVWPVEYARLTLERDSLQRETARRDTALVGSIAEVRRLAQRVRSLSSVSGNAPTSSPAAIGSVALTPVTPVAPDPASTADTLARMCAALAADCDAFRTTATAALAKADSTRHADSVATTRLSLLVVDRDRRIVRLEARPTWGTVTKTCTVATAVGVVGGFFLR